MKEKTSRQLSISTEVIDKLEELAKGFETPDATLRRLLGLQARKKRSYFGRKDPDEVVDSLAKPALETEDESEVEAESQT